MPTCQNCGKKWTWKQTIKTLFRLKCPYCGEKQYESTPIGKRIALLVPIPLVLTAIDIWLDVSLGTSFVFAAILIVFLVCLYPFILKLSNEQKYPL